VIDPITGAISFDDGTVIAPSVSRTVFAASAIAVEAALDGTPEYPAFRLKPRLMDGTLFGSHLIFCGEILWTITLSRSDPNQNENSWDDWTMEAEVATQKWNEAWLARTLGPPHESLPWKPYLDRQIYRFAWGTIESAFVPQTGCTTLGVYYEQGKP